MAKKVAEKSTELVAVERETRDLAAESTPMQSWLTVKKLQDEVQFQQADQALGAVKDLLNKAEEKRVGYTKPLNQVLKAINADFKAVTEPLVKLETHIKHQLFAPYIASKMAAAQKAAEKVAVKEEQKGNLQFADDLRQAALQTTGIPEAVSGLSTREQWKAKVVDLSKLLAAIAASPGLQRQLNGALVEVLEKQFSALARVAKSSDAAPAGVTYFAELVIGKAV